LDKKEIFIVKNKKRSCRECPECNLGPKTSCFWEVEKRVPEQFKPSLIKAYVSLESVNGINYLQASEMDKDFDSEFLSWLVSFCVGSRINLFWKTKNIPFCLGSTEFIEVLTRSLQEEADHS
jgi:hypothetical protein